MILYYLLFFISVSAIGMEPENKKNFLVGWWNKVENFFNSDDEMSPVQKIEDEIDYVINHSDLQEHEKKLHLLALYEKANEYYPVTMAKHLYYAKEIHVLKIYKLRTDIKKSLEIAHETKDISKELELYKLLEKTFSSPEKKKEIQKKINILEKEINHSKSIQELSDQLLQVTNDKLLKPLQKLDRLAGILEKRAFLYDRLSQPLLSVQDKKKADDFRRQIIAQSPAGEQANLLRAFNKND